MLGKSEASWIWTHFRRSAVRGLGVCCAVLMFLWSVGGTGHAGAPKTVVWHPLERPQREADTLFLPDFSSWKTIDAEGGVLAGPQNMTSEQVQDNYEFGPGKFGPAVRAKPGKFNFIFYPVDGLLDGEEFTIEFWAKWEKPWSALDTGRPIFAISGPGVNVLQITPHRGQLQVMAQAFADLRDLSFSKAWQAPCDKLNLTGDTWHALALTFKAGVLRIYINGKEVGQLKDIRWLPLWSDGGRYTGIQISGVAGAGSGVWFSDLRISRSARVPSQAVPLRSLEGQVVVDVQKVAGTLPPHLLGSLGPPDPQVHTPQQIRDALQVLRLANFLGVTPIKRGKPDAEYPSSGPSGQFAYDWQVVDRTMDWLQRCGVSACICISSAPHILGGRAKPYEGKMLRTSVVRGPYNPQVPNNFEDWAAIVKDMTHHLVVEKKYPIYCWTVWNEPDLGTPFWQGSLERYLDFYVVTARAVREVDPRTPIGGPESASLNVNFIQNLFARCARDKVPLDFLNYHEYSGCLTNLDRARRVIDHYAKKYGYPTPFPIVLGEFNWAVHGLYKTGIQPFRGSPWHIRAFGAAYTTAFLTRMVELPACDCLIYAHTRYGTLGPRAGSAASCQLLGPHGEQWAPYNVFKGWKQVMGSQRLAADRDLPPGVFVLSTRDPQTGRLGLALANYGWAQRQPRTVHITLRSLRPGAWKLKRYLVDAQHSSRWDIAEDRPEGKSQNDLQLVEENTGQVGAEGIWQLHLQLPAWSSTFLSLEPPP